MILFATTLLVASCGDDDDDDNDDGVTLLNSFPDLSGLTWMGENHLLAVHDAKNEEGKENDPRISALSLSENLDVTLTQVNMDWGEELLSDDLESVCALSAKPFR